MFTRVVETTAKAGKTLELANIISEKILPILRQQPGFLDETVLTSDVEANRVLTLSFWRTKEDAERYHKENFPKITEMVSQVVDTTPVVRTFNVHSSTQHKIAAGRAA
jgi:heme-degrading monooxygenase HmoA